MSEIPHNPLEGERPELTINLHDGSDEQISIVIVHKDRPEYLNILLQSIAVTSYNNNYEIIVVDNASGPESQDYLNDIDGEIKVIRNDKNLFYGPAANKGFEASNKNSKYVVFMHCDVVVLNAGWLDLMINVLESQGSGFVGLEMQSYYLGRDKVDFIQEWCMMVTRECWKKVGPFPDKCPQIGASFIPTIKAKYGGFNPQIMRNQICHHYRIFSLDINEYERLTEKAMVVIPQLLRDVQTKN